MKKPDLKKTFSTLKNTRAVTKTPKFFKIIRNIGLVATGIGIAIATAPVSLPAAVVSAGTYLAWIGGTAASISQLTKE